MDYQNQKEKRKAVCHAVAAYVASGVNKTAAVKKVAKDFGYLTEVPVWNALKKEREENDG